MLPKLALGMGLAMGCAIAVAGGAAAADRILPKMADKALYCTELYLEAARMISDDGDPIAGRAIRYFSKNWLDMAFKLADGMSRHEVNALRPQYAAEAKRDVASKRYRYQRCGSMTNTR